MSSRHSGHGISARGIVGGTGVASAPRTLHHRAQNESSATRTGNNEVCGVAAPAIVVQANFLDFGYGQKQFSEDAIGINLSSDLPLRSRVNHQAGKPEIHRLLRSVKSLCITMT